MKCPECGNECKKGFVEIRDAGSLLQSLTTATWFPEENKGKIIRKDFVTLKIDAVGYYCDKCMKVYSVFEEK